jgi:ketosteroid isomerase-like protein
MDDNSAEQKNTGVVLPAWATGIYNAIDQGDVDKFVTYFSSDGTFGFDGISMVKGHVEIKHMVTEFLSSFDTLVHHFEECITQGNTTFIRGRVDYIIDNRTTNVGWAVCFHLNDGLIQDYLIYMDPMPLMRLQGVLPE